MAVISVAMVIAAIIAAVIYLPQIFHHQVSEAVPQQCSLPCIQLLSNITTTNGHLSCSSEVVRLQCDTGFLPETVGHMNCSSGPTSLASLKCLQQICPAPSHPAHGQVFCKTAYTVGSSCKVTCTHGATTGEASQMLACRKNLTWSPLPSCLPPSCGSLAECQRQVMMLAGGELAGQAVNLVRPYPSSFAVYTSCLPHLPHRLKWGTMGFVEGSLIACGGENTTESQSRACWILDNRTHTWMDHCNLTSARSQSASTVSADGKFLDIISGYADWTHDRGLPTRQRVGLGGAEGEEELILGAGPYSTRLAVAVTLSSGDVLVTGGMNRERVTVLLSHSSHGKTLVTELQRMHHGRIGHAGAVMTVQQEEQVVMAGGWDQFGVALDTVELFTLARNSWILIPEMKQPRADFLLLVRSFCAKEITNLV